MRVFISVPMNGRTEEDIYQDIETVKKALGNNRISYINSMLNIDPPLGTSTVGAWFLGKSIELIAQSDLVVFVKGYEKARGCRIEEMVCKEYGIPRKYMEEAD